MAETVRRSYARPSGPRPVESRSSSYSSARKSSKNSSTTTVVNKTNKRHYHRIDSQPSSDLDYQTEAFGQYPAVSSSRPSEDSKYTCTDFNLLFMSQLPASMSVGSRFQPSVILTAQGSAPRKPTSSGLMAVATVLGSNGKGQWISSPPGVLRGKHPVDNLHELPADYRNRLPRDLERVSQGYFAFPDVAICKPGVYRVRISLVSFPDARSGQQDTETLMHVDSNAFRVNRDDEKPDYE